MRGVTFDKIDYTLDIPQGPFDGGLAASGESGGLTELRLTLRAEEKSVPPVVRVAFDIPDIGVQSRWIPSLGLDRRISADWSANSISPSRAAAGAPVYALIGYGGENRLTVAVSDALNPIEIKAGLSEETARIKIEIRFFTGTMAAIDRYEAVIRLDARSIDYARALSQVSSWWASLPGYAPAHVPDDARLPMYSAWYSFHQQLEPQAVVRQCHLARELGCSAIIVDDGWQTDDNSRGYAYCGDWEAKPAKIPDMRAFVDAVHETGLKFMLWYSVPFVGRHSKAWEKFSTMFLDGGDREWCVLDPRFPQVREYLINVYEKAVRDWGLDGFKLDFIDAFGVPQGEKPAYGGGRDIASVDAAVDRLLKDTLSRLRAINPEIMIEFRQSYIGPLMRTYGNMFRAGDCPNDALTNRQRTLDVRLLCGSSAAHSDMLMWNEGDSVESAAMQLIGVLFSVPQISVMLDRIPHSHFEMLRHYLRFWIENRDTLLDGKLTPLHPEANFTCVLAQTEKTLIAASYVSGAVSVPAKRFERICLINGTYERRMIADFGPEGPESGYTYEVLDCTGARQGSSGIKAGAGIAVIDVPPAGMAVLKPTLR